MSIDMLFKAVDRFRSRHIRTAGALAAAVCASLGGTYPVRALAQDSTRIALGPGGDRITISAAGITRAQLLEMLRTKYRIEVRPYDAPSEQIALNFVNQPIDSAIGMIMPRGSRYVVRVGERDVASTVAGEGEKKGAPERRPSGLARKTSSPFRQPRGKRFKPAPERVGERPAAQGRGLKPLPDTSQEVAPGRGPKIARSARVEADSTVRFSFTIRAPDTIQIVRATVIEGMTPEVQLVRGPFLFALRTSAGGLVFFGSLPDPLEEHAYQTDGQHGQARAREGTFAISVPARTVTPARLPTLRLEFYDARDVSLPATLDARAFESAVAQAKPVARVDGPALLSALRGRSR